MRRERKKIKLLSPSFHPSFVTQSSRAEGGPLLDATRALPLRFEMMETYELLLLGGGHAHVMTLRRWEKRRAPSSSSSTSSALPSAPASPPLQQRPRLALVSSSPASCYSGMLPGVIAGLYAPEQALVPLAPRTGAAAPRLHCGEAVGQCGDISVMGGTCEGRRPALRALLRLCGRVC